MWIENQKSYRRRQIICAILGICASMIFVFSLWERREVIEAKDFSIAQKDLSEHVLRFHVLANSDSEKDQKLKLEVRDGILSYMEEEMPAGNHAQVKAWIFEHLSEIENAGMQVLFREGRQERINARICTCYFPERTYGSVIFPKGYYETLRVEVGNACGKNWWCVLYPALCFVDATYAEIPEDGEEVLSEVLCEKTCETISVTSNNYKIKSFFWEFWKEKTNDSLEDGQ